LPDLELLIAKAAAVERGVARVREESVAAGEHFNTDFTRQDAAVLNLQRACEAAIDMAQHIFRTEQLGVASTAGETFDLVARAGWIDPTLAERLRRMVGFRNIAVHDYQTLFLGVVVDIIQNHLDDFTMFTRAVLTRRS
jgi:uncharacterized protein YutE (UPF0331/DUF86 family)